MVLLDAHTHLHDPRFEPVREEIHRVLRDIGVAGAVVNGTAESDWGDVAAMAAAWHWVIPSFGLHPWYLKARTSGWEAALERRLSDHAPRVGVGEFGLDRRMEGLDWEDQKSVFRRHLELAARWNLVATIHCIEAWGPLLEEMQSGPVPERGFLVHAYGGSPEMALRLGELGGYFSFSTSFLDPRKASRRETFAKLPLDRVLVETDAPGKAPPAGTGPWELSVGPSGERINHPGNLLSAYEDLARLRGLPVEELGAVVAGNFARLFGVRVP